MTQVLYISYDGMTDPLGQSQVLPYLIGLSKKGFSITLISFEKQAPYKQYRSEIQDLCDQTEIDWVPLHYTKRPPVLSTLFDCWKLKRTAFRLHRKKQFSIVHCRSYITALIGLTLRENGVKMIFDMRGFWADERVEGGIWNKNKLIYRWIYSYFKKKEIDFFTKSDTIVSLTNAGKQEILSWKLPTVDESKITVIPCCANLNLFNPDRFGKEQQIALRKQLQLTDEFIVGYVGSIGTWYMLDEMLRLYTTLLIQYPSAIFLFVTKEPAATIWQKSDQLSIHRNQLRIVSASHKEVPSYLSILDAALFFIRPSFSKMASSPTKQGEIMAMGIPLICNTGIGDTAAIVETYKAGQILDISHPESLTSFRFNPIEFDASTSRKGAQEIFGLDQGISNYWQIYNRLIEPQ
jgi:glycosyltransferase involved in cell wall biosynthesis